MTVDQGILFAILVLVLGLLVWGRWRYDIVAFGALVVAHIVGVVPRELVFSGIGHPATVIIALVLIVSSGLSASGAIEILSRRLLNSSRGLRAHIGIMSTVAAVLSSLMNNVAALAILMPIDMQAASKAKRSPALTLMPLSFASILGGMVTLIGTPPNVVIATFRDQVLGTPYGMFDFAPVGLVVAVVGVLYVALIGWRLIPLAPDRNDTAQELRELEGYVAEAKVGEGAPVVGKPLRELVPLAEKHDVSILGLVRRGKRMPGAARFETVRQSDMVVLEGSPDAIEEFLGAARLEYTKSKKHEGIFGGTLAVAEVVVPEGASIEGRSALEVSLLYRRGVTLLGVSRRGKRFRDRVRKLKIRAGDVLLLLGREENLPDVVSWLGCLPLAPRGLQVKQRRKAWMAVGIFGGAIALASLGLLYLPMALAAVVVLYALLGIVPLSKLYTSIEWPVIILLGSLIPIGAALEESGGTLLIAQSIVDWTQGLDPAAILVILMIVTMTLSDVLNNVATALIAAPIGVEIATQLEVNPDPFLMGVAVACSCAFLSPIGHKNNTIIMGPGGYRFGDYWRMGLPLEGLVLLVGVPMILLIWPL